MPEEVLFEMEQRQSRSEIADYLRAVADKLDSDAEITFESGGQSVTMDPPANPEFEVKVEREGPKNGAGELSIELEVEWDEDQSGSDGSDGGLSIS